MAYDFLLCTHCQTVRSTPFAIYRITPKTPSETFIAIGMSIALEKQFGYEIPKILLTANSQDIPSLLSGYGVGEAQNDKQRKACLRKFIPVVVQKVRETSWKPRPLPFVEIRPHNAENPTYSDQVKLEMMSLESSLETIEEVNLEAKAIPEELLRLLPRDTLQSQEIDNMTELVRATLRHMPQQYRAALLLQTQERFTYAEIAQALNIAEKSVGSCLTRARRSFREHYRAVEQLQEVSQELEGHDKLGIPNEIYSRLHMTLLECDSFDSDQQLRAVITNSSLAPLLNQLPQANNLNDRVDAIISFLIGKRLSGTQTSALVQPRGNSAGGYDMIEYRAKSGEGDFSHALSASKTA